MLKLIVAVFGAMLLFGAPSADAAKKRTGTENTNKMSAKQKCLRDAKKRMGRREKEMATAACG